VTYRKTLRTYLRRALELLPPNTMILAKRPALS
jgi:hypothetical protein